MIVVADTSPLNYLIQIDYDTLLPRLYGRIVVPSGVMRELRHVGAPAAVQAWLAQIPCWIDVRATLSSPDAELAFLGWGSGRRFSSRTSSTLTCCLSTNAKDAPKRNVAD